MSLTSPIFSPWSDKQHGILIDMRDHPGCRVGQRPLAWTEISEKTGHSPAACRLEHERLKRHYSKTSFHWIDLWKKTASPPVPPLPQPLWDQRRVDKFTRYLRSERFLSPNTVEAYTYEAKRFSHFMNSDEQTRYTKKVTLDICRRFIFHAAEKHDLCASSQARMIAALKEFLKFLHGTGKLKDNPALSLEQPATEQKIVTVMTYREVERMCSYYDLDSKQSVRNRAILETLYSTGIRVSELAGIKMSHIYSRDGFIKVDGKGSKERLVPIGEEALEFIGMYLATRSDRTSEYLFLHVYKDCQIIRQEIGRVVKKARVGIKLKKKVSPHTFRHTFATHMMEGMTEAMGHSDLVALSAMMGHESVDSTAVYCHVTSNYKKKVLEKFMWKGKWSYDTSFEALCKECLVPTHGKMALKIAGRLETHHGKEKKQEIPGWMR